MDVFDLEGELATLDGVAARVAEHRNDVSRAAAGAAGSQAEGTMRAKARALSEAVTNIEQAVMWGRRAQDGTATAAAQGAVPAAYSTITQSGGITASTGPSGSAMNNGGAFPVTVSADGGDPFAKAYLTVRPESVVNDLVRAAIERCGVQHTPGVWALHRHGKALVGENTAAEAGLQNGDELVLLRVAE